MFMRESPAPLDGLNIPHQTGVPLAPLTWYRVGGPAEILAQPTHVEQLSNLTARCRQDNVPLYPLGRGANLLVADAGVKGVVVQLNAPAFRQFRIRANRVRAGAGFDLMQLVLKTAQAGLSGLECLAGIPATVGGAVRMNAGGTFGEIGPSVSRIRVLDESGTVIDLDRKQLQFSYRKTNLESRLILDVEFDLIPADNNKLVQRVKEIFASKAKSQPLAAHSPGCAFKNPPHVPAGIPPTAGQLIDEAGLKGFRSGKAEVSQRHANFILANPGASAAHIVAVMQHVEQTVEARFGVKLEREIILWP